VTLHHLTLPKRLPMIEQEGLRTRADLSGYYGPPGPFDAVAPGTYAFGKRVSGWASLAARETRVAELGAGYVTYSVDPARVLANRASLRAGDPQAYWASTRPLAAWLSEGPLPDDLEVHQNVGVRAKRLELRAPLFGAEQLGEWTPVVAAVADADRLSAKALMHLALIASDADFDSVDFDAACALACRDEPDPDRLLRELSELDPDKVVSAVLAEHSALAADLVARLREVLEETRTWADEQGISHGDGLFARASAVLDELPGHLAATDGDEPAG
jgi:hypothetical protein